MKRIAAVLAVLLLVVAAGCDRTDLIGSPQNGQIVPGDTVTVTGVLPADVPGGGTISANGVTTTVAADRTWSVDIPQAASGYVTPVEVDLHAAERPESPPAHRRRPRRQLDDGQISPDGVGMRFTNAGLTDLGPVIKSLAGGAFDIGGLLLAAEPDHQPAGRVPDHRHHRQRLRGRHRRGRPRRRRAPTTGVATHITIDDLYVGVDLHITDGLAINLDCGLELQIPTTTIDATFDLEPTAGDPSRRSTSTWSAPPRSTPAR